MKVRVALRISHVAWMVIMMCIRGQPISFAMRVGLAYWFEAQLASGGKCDLVHAATDASL